MSLKRIVRELTDMSGSGGTSRRGSAVADGHTSHGDERSWSELWPAEQDEEREQQGQWANLPPELLLDVIWRVEASEVTWPARRQVTSCATVCRSWRDITKEVVKTVEECGRITFPSSLKQPGPREYPIQCFVRRDRSSSTFRLYLGLSPSLHSENDKLLLAARRVRRPTCTDFIISLSADDISRASSSYVGKLRSNFLGTKFTIFDINLPCNATVASSTAVTPTSRLACRINSKQVSPRLPAGNYAVGTVGYEMTVMRNRGPRRMQCTMHSIPVSAIREGGKVPMPVDPAVHTSDEQPPKDSSASGADGEEPLVLKNKAPRWHEHLQCWCLNFRGRVTVASVKNFQLVASIDPERHRVPPAEQEKVILQFGKIGKDIFTMDYRYPLSAFQAFAICLSSFDSKPACE